MAIILDGTTGVSTPGVTDTGDLSVAGNTALTTPLPVTSGGTGATSLSGITVGTATNATNATTATNLAAGSAGTVPYQSASGTTAMLSAGTSGQVLTSSGAGAPSWTTPSAGAMTLLATVTASSSATVSFNSTYLTTTYDTYLIVATSVSPATNSTIPYFYISSDNGSTFSTTMSSVGVGGAAGQSTSVFLGSNTSNPISLIGGLAYGGTDRKLNNGTGKTFNANIWLYRPATSTYFQAAWTASYITDQSDWPCYISMSVGASAAAAINYVKFAMSSGNIASGTFRLYGIANS